ncbi:helix-turn-helix transcriptional regulator [Methanobrevibacter sp. DSM 116169]|uniref:helix-turn-helix transcriptional regulator n=1 Tax=Methanobrevibacter sp. DSM 116169 TaxID=3242727 RepID=UPI0038FBF65A
MKNNPLKIKVTEDSENHYMKAIKIDDFTTLYEFDFEGSGNGQMICYEVFPGISLSKIDVNGFHLDNFKRINQNREITINHCRKGRFECNFYGKYQYLEEGDLVAVTKSAHEKYSGFPLGYYEGIEIFIDMEIAKNSLNNILGYSFDLEELYSKISDNENIILIKATKEIDHIFSEMYNVSEKIKSMYFKLKILELFLFLEIQPLDYKLENRPQLSKKQVDIVKKVQNEIVQNINEPITLEYLSNKYNIGITSLKNSFKTVYGKPLFAWRKDYRLQIAKNLLKESDMAIGDIALKVGYNNSSKFTAAFKQYYNITPSEYRLNQK